MKLILFSIVSILLLTYINKEKALGEVNNVISYANNNTDANNYVNNIYANNIYTGLKWQCVEFARRYLIINYNITFDSIDNAYNIFDLPYFISLKNNMIIPIRKYVNGSKTPPMKDSLLIWNSDHKKTGHVAIITNINNDMITIAEQNYNNNSWNGNNYSRKLKIVFDNGYYIKSNNILGWINYNLT